MAVKSRRIVTDAGDTLVLTKWDVDESMSVDLISDDGRHALQVTLTKRDVEEISAVIHDHE